MSWRDCIQSAIDSGRISAAKGGRAFEAFDEAYDETIAGGATEGEAVMRAADLAVERITELNKGKRWARINEMQRQHEIYQRLMKAPDPRRELENLMNDADLSYDTVRGFAMANLDRLLMKYKPRKGGLHIPTDGLDGIVRAAYKEGGTPEDKELFEAIFEAQEILRKEANMYGASIPENPNRRLAQTHDQKLVQAVQKETWVEDHMRTLDWEIMRFEGKNIPVDKREEVLERVYDGIVNDGAGRGNPAQNQQGSLATRLARDRFLYYKDADSYIAMQKKYGRGNLYEQTIGLIDHMSMEISLLKHFGPSPDTAKEFAKRVGRERAAEINNSRAPGKRTVVQKYDDYAREVFDEMYAIHTRKIGAPDGNLMAQTFSTLRTLAVSAKLGGVFIPTVFGDIANARVARLVMNLPEVRVIRSYFGNFVPTKAKTEEAIRAGIIFENGISLAFNRQRYFGALDGPHWARRWSDITYRTGLAAHATQVGRNAAGKEFMGVLAQYKDTPFDDLAFAPLLIENGITREDWDTFRATPLYQFGGATWLRPIDMWSAGDDTAKKVAEKFQNAMQLYIRTAVPEPTLRSRVAMGEAWAPNAFRTQVFRTMTSLLSFPVSIYFNQLRRIADAPRLRDKLNYGARYFAWMTAGGMFITQAKALANGQELYNMDPTLALEDFPRFADFYGRALLNGGSLGILGDFVFNNINLSNSSYRPGNPTAEYLKTLHKLTLDNMIDAGHALLYDRGSIDTPPDELDVGRDTLRFLDANVPDLWYAKLIWQRALTDDMFERADPAGWQRYQRYLQEHEEGMWWEPGEEPTAPNLETAVSDE